MAPPIQNPESGLTSLWNDHNTNWNDFDTAGGPGLWSSAQSLWSDANTQWDDYGRWNSVYVATWDDPTTPWGGVTGATTWNSTVLILSAAQMTEVAQAIDQATETIASHVSLSPEVAQAVHQVIDAI